MIEVGLVLAFFTLGVVGVLMFLGLTSAWNAAVPRLLPRTVKRWNDYSQTQKERLVDAAQFQFAAFRRVP